MNEEQLSYILKNKKWKFSFLDYLNRYFIVALPVAFIILGIYPLFDKKYFNRVNLSDFLSLFPFWFLLAGILLLAYSLRRIESERAFRKIGCNSKLTAEEFSIVLNELDWSVQEIKSNYVIAETDWSAFSWGEEITVVLCAEYLLINSRTTGSQPFTLGRDIYNYNKLKELLELKLLV